MTKCESMGFAVEALEFEHVCDKEQREQPAPVAQWLARRTVGRKVWGSNPIRVMWDFSALAGPGRLLPRAGSAMGPMGRLEPHSRASSS